MRIGFDLDGVLADLHRAFWETAQSMYPDVDNSWLAAQRTEASPPQAGANASEVPGESEEAASTQPLSGRKRDAVWERLTTTTDFWTTLQEIEPGAIRRLAEITEERKWEVIFLTSRPTAPGLTVQRQSQQWLERLGFPMPSLFVVHGSRGKIAEALGLDVVVDDRPENCLDIALESKARAILVWRGPSEKVPPATRRIGIGVVPTVAGCLELLTEAEREAATPDDLVLRLRKLLGLVPKPKPR